MDTAMGCFKTYVGIDYSGAGKTMARNRGLQVFRATADTDPVKVNSPAGAKLNWTRKEIAHWICDLLRAEAPVIVGLDHGFSFPLTYMKRHGITGWDRFLDDFQAHWPTDQDAGAVESLRPGNKRTGKPTEFRLTEKWTASTQSVFKLDGAGTVGKSTLCGIPWLRFIRRHTDERSRPHFWPFDGFSVPPGRSVVAEIFPSIFRRRYPRRYQTADEHDAMCVAWWLKDMDARGRLSAYFKPPLTAEEHRIARLEGWILGIY